MGDTYYQEMSSLTLDLTSLRASLLPHTEGKEVLVAAEPLLLPSSTKWWLSNPVSADMVALQVKHKPIDPTCGVGSVVRRGCSRTVQAEMEGKPIARMNSAQGLHPCTL